MAPSTLSPNVLHVLLQYISPPSQLTHPVPPHLLSKPLLQRHHFLHLTPEHPVEYLCWPSSLERTAHAINLLESRSRPIDDDRPAVFPVQYSFDGEDFFAHVDLSCDVGDGPRIILQWDDDSGEWKYHNLDLMPFPPGSRAVLEDVLVPPPPPNPVSRQTISTPSYLRGFGPADLQDDSDDDDYWNAYGSTDIGDSLYNSGLPTSAKDVASSEDAYWAQYASVQGTADSTIPSPAPQRRKPLPPVYAENGKVEDSPAPLLVPVRVPSEDTYAEPLPIPPSIMPRPRGNSRWDPASPTTLARLLSTISPRESLAPSPAPGSSFDMEMDGYEELSSPTVGGSNDSDLSSSPGLGLQRVDIAPMKAAVTGSDSFPAMSSLSSIESDVGLQPALAFPSDAVPCEKTAGVDDEDEADLRAAMEGVWRMWRKVKGKAAGPSISGHNEAREAFLRTAQWVADRA